uniref:hypothetical protein n=1 Tax=Trichocoleus desertorum TaxID=1481672 RepID=UPI0025B3E34C|nr:hypothetical protein [Trichocoleus desertorum]
MAVELSSLRKNLIYQKTAAIAQVLHDLDEIEALDLVAEKQQARYRNLLIGFGIAAFVSIFIPVVGVILCPILAIAAVIFGVLMARKGRLNVANYRYAIAQKVLQMLARDMSEAAPITFTLVLSKPNQKEKQTHTAPHPYRPGWKIDVFRDTWLQVQSEFLDGNQFLLSATEVAQTQYGWKRSSSGKSKYKSKTKSKRLELNLEMDYSAKRYGAVPILKDEAAGAIQLPPEVILKRLDINEKDIHLRVKTPPWNQPEHLEQLYQAIAMMFLSLYQVLNLARVLSKKAE